MTSSQTGIDIDPAPYSTRQCRCGVDMQHHVPPSAFAWTCEVCGRRSRQ